MFWAAIRRAGMNDQPLKGEYGIPVYRSSTEEQLESVPAQRRYIGEWFDRAGMIALDPIDFGGRTGSDERNIDAIADEVIRRKLAGEPVAYLVFYDSTRRARTGAQHWMTVKHRLGIHGIQVIAITRWSPVQMPGEDILDCIDAYAARQSSETAANASARNSQLRLLDGKRNHSSRAPYGLDRLYIDSKDEPVEIVREHPDGRREVIDAVTGNTKYTLQKGELYDKSDRHRVELIEGQTERVEAVRRIFHLKYVQELGPSRIAGILNDDRIMSPRGGYWCQFVRQPDRPEPGVPWTRPGELDQPGVLLPAAPGWAKANGPRCGRAGQGAPTTRGLGVP
jgi:hypothetical protein